MRGRLVVLVLLALALLPEPRVGEAQRAATIPRVGFLSPSTSSDPRVLARFKAFQEGLRELGCVEGQNIALEVRWAEGNWDRLSSLASDLVRQRVNVSGWTSS